MALRDPEAPQAPSRADFLRSSAATPEPPPLPPGAAMGVPPRAEAPRTPEQVGSDRERAVALMHEGRYTDALPVFDRVAGAFTTDMWFQHDYAQTLTAVCGRSNVDQAVSILQQTLSTPDGGNNSWLHVRLAEAYGRRNDYDAAREEYQRARALDRDNGETTFLSVSEGDPYAAANKLHEEGKADIEAGRIHEGLKKLEKAIILVGDEKEPWSVYDKGEGLARVGDIHGAIESFETAEEIMPHEVWPKLKLAQAYEFAARFDDARDVYREVLDIDPDNEEARRQLESLERTEGTAVPWSRGSSSQGPDVPPPYWTVPSRPDASAPPRWPGPPAGEGALPAYPPPPEERRGLGDWRGRIKLWPRHGGDQGQGRR